MGSKTSQTLEKSKSYWYEVTELRCRFLTLKYITELSKEYVINGVEKSKHLSIQKREHMTVEIAQSVLLPIENVTNGVLS